MNFVFIFYLFLSFICYISTLSEDCKSKVTKPCDNKKQCLNATFKALCKVDNCDAVYKDGYNQLMDCDYGEVVLDLTNTGAHDIIELACRDEKMQVVILSADFINNKGKRDVSEDLIHNCALKNFCSYRANHLSVCPKDAKCFSQLKVSYFCKETGTEEISCSNQCNNNGRCLNCIPHYLNPLKSQCTLCKCHHSEQLIYSNGTVINRYCKDLYQSKSQISSSKVIVAVVCGTIFSGFMFAVIGFVCIFIFRRNRYRRNDHQGLMSYPVEQEM